MLLSPVIMRVLLALCLVGMAMIAALYLRQRRLSWTAYLGWGLILVLVPLLGPFLVILHKPGEKNSSL